MFKELGQAYEVLSDPEKKDLYDQYGEDAFKEGIGGAAGSPFHNPFHIFKSFFGAGFGDVAQKPDSNDKKEKVAQKPDSKDKTEEVAQSKVERAESSKRIYDDCTYQECPPLNISQASQMENAKKPKGDDIEEKPRVTINPILPEIQEAETHSVIKSDDSEWFFLCPCNYKYAKSNKVKRGTMFGFWKATGKDLSIKIRGTD
ncbi:hypothetical protein OROGR_006997 [Orobanche gracilis]